MGNENTNWGQSVTGVAIKEDKVLLARHTYGGGKGMLIIPGGYVNFEETPQEALVREYMEETQIEVKPMDIIGVRFNMHDWYIAFRAEYGMMIKILLMVHQLSVAPFLTAVLTIPNLKAFTKTVKLQSNILKNLFLMQKIKM